MTWTQHNGIVASKCPKRKKRNKAIVQIISKNKIILWTGNLRPRPFEMLLIPRTRSRPPRKAGLGQSPWIISNLCSICFARCSERMRQGPPRGRSDHRFKHEPAKQGCSLRVRQLCSRIELSSNWVETSYHSGLQAGSWDGYTKPSLYMDEGKRLPRRIFCEGTAHKASANKGYSQARHCHHAFTN